MRLDELELRAPATGWATATASYSLPSASTGGRTNVQPQRLIFPVVLALILIGGTLLRLYLPTAFKTVGFDENVYRTYVTVLERHGLLQYPGLINAFISHQLDPHHQAILPPTRLLYIIGGYSYHRIFGLTPLDALQTLSCHFSILTLLVAAFAAWRMTKNRLLTLGVAALMACAPTEIHLGQHSLIDGVFGFWALLVTWLFWENLNQPRRVGWLLSYGAAMALLVTTKENAFFIFVVIVLMLGCNRWLKLGSVNSSLILATFGGAAVGFALVMLAAGGLEPFALVFGLLAKKVPVLPYTIETGGGPWHRYLVDLLLVSPAVLLLAVANVLQRAENRIASHRFLIVFSCLLYAVLTAFPGGMNLRYIAVLDMPLCFFAAMQLIDLSGVWKKYSTAIFACALVAVCTQELWQHYVLFGAGGLYELVTEGLVRAQGIIK